MSINDKKSLTNNIFKLIDNQKDFESIYYDSKPNLRYKETVVNDFQKDYWNFDNYDIYYSKNDLNEKEFDIFLVYGDHNNNNINIVRIRDKKLIKSLTGHEESVDIVKHFYDKDNHKNYLLSADYSKIVIVWDLNKYNQVFKIKTNYSKYMYALTIIFENKYIITSTRGTSSNDYIKLYSLTNGKFIANIENTNNTETFYLLHWNYNYKNYLIELCYENIFIYDLSNNKLYKDLTSKNYNSSNSYYSGFISSDNKYLYASTNKGIIFIWNLLNSTLAYKFMIENSSFLKILLWSTEIINNTPDSKEIKNEKIYNYILISDKKKKGFFCINISFDRKTINNMKVDKNFNAKVYSFYARDITIKCIRKIIHPIYGECLISSGDNYNIDLWINNNNW